MKNTDQKMTLKCPLCKEIFPVDDAIKSQLVESVTKEASEKIKMEQDIIFRKEKELSAKQQNFDKQKDAFDEEVKSGVEKLFETEKIKITKDAEKKAEAKFYIEIKDKDEQIKEKDKAVEEAKHAQLNALKKEREAEEKIKNVDLEVEKKLKIGKDEMENDISKRYADTYSLKDQEKQKKIDDLAKQLDDAKRRLELGSQQLQGEIQELDLEMALRDAFPQDIIEPIGKGIKGADVRQKVITNSGKISGVILWESKNTKNWTESWIEVLKGKLRAEAAHIPVIVSTKLPEEAISGFGNKNGVWICKPSLAVGVAHVLRKELLEVYIANARAENRGTLADSLYEYVTGHEFRQQIEAMVEVFVDMKDQINKEKMVFEKTWKMREAQVEKIFIGTARIVGSIQGKLGNSTFGPVKGLELLEGRNEEKK